ncbi:MAG: hypothetical protein BWY71_01332 [Planctomycetes bacterium ADurb.Bin412]|nr:MAG: hypothetical protein BWY71_01332 [Planctomycetes bacterium ADurb.Bin412]
MIIGLLQILYLIALFARVVQLLEGGNYFRFV